MVPNRGHGGYWRIVAATIQIATFLASTPGISAQARDLPWFSEAVTSSDQTTVEGHSRSSNSDGNASGQEETTKHWPSDGQVEIGTPISTTSAETTSAQDKCKTAEQLNDRDCRDLLAQERMGRAAWWQVALTAAGVILICRTLYHTKIAAKAARDTVEEAKDGTNTSSPKF
jgi:hypothetical protein